MPPFLFYFVTFGQTVNITQVFETPRPWVNRAQAAFQARPFQSRLLQLLLPTRRPTHAVMADAYRLAEKTVL